MLTWEVKRFGLGLKMRTARRVVIMLAREVKRSVLGCDRKEEHGFQSLGEYRLKLLDNHFYIFVPDVTYHAWSKKKVIALCSALGFGPNWS